MKKTINKCVGSGKKAAQSRSGIPILLYTEISLIQIRGGIVFEGGKSISSIIAGLIVFVLGSVPLMGMMGIISFQIPEIPKIILQIILAASGFYLMIDGFFEFGMHPGFAWVSIIIGFSVTLAGILTTLSDLGSFAVTLGFLTSTVIYVLYVIVGILLILGAFMF